jgi:hypothetical protein
MLGIGPRAVSADPLGTLQVDAPASGVVDGHDVTVSGAHFAPDTAYRLVQCALVGMSVVCDTATATEPVTTDSFGFLPGTSFTVHALIHTPDPFDCTVFGNQCGISVLALDGSQAAFPAQIWFAGSVPATMFGSVTDPQGIPLPGSVYVVFCKFGPCTNGYQLAQVNQSHTYSFFGLEPGQLYDVVAVQLNGPSVVSASAHVQVTPTSGQQIAQDFTLTNAMNPPSGGFVSGTVTDLDGVALPADPHGGTGGYPLTGVLACPGTSTYGSPQCSGVNVITTPTDVAGGYRMWLADGAWNLAGFTFFNSPAGRLVSGDYLPVTVPPPPAPTEPLTAGRLATTASIAATTLTVADQTADFVVPVAWTLTSTSPTVVLDGTTATLSALLLDQAGRPVADIAVTVRLGTQSCAATTAADGTATCTITVAQPLGPVTADAAFAANPAYRPSALVRGVVYGLTAGGSFVIGDKNVVVGSTVTFWGDQWAKKNKLTGSATPKDFEGFANSPAGAPACGSTWSFTGGKSANPPKSIPAYTAMIVTSSIGKAHGTLSGTTTTIAIVRVDKGYPRHGTATVVALLPCA